MAMTRRTALHDLDLDPNRPLPRRADDGAARRGSDPATRPLTISRSPALDAASLLHLQRVAGNAGVVQMLAADEEEASPVHEVVGRGGGEPLDPETKSTMEGAYGDSFDDVRIHTDATASKSAESVGANAYTVGTDVVFREGHGPGSSDYARNVAHELEHVRQQKDGPVDGTEAGGGIRVSDPSDRFEQAASSKADQVLAGVQTLQADDLAGAAPALQRQADEDEEEDEQGR
jgi:hypothetical protein